MSIYIAALISAAAATASGSRSGIISATATSSVSTTASSSTATSCAAPRVTAFASPYSAFSATLFSNRSSRTWPNWTPGLALPTDTSDPYGDAAYSQLWNLASPLSFSRGLYSTTVSPTPVPSSELVPPPPLVFGPQDEYTVPRDFVLGIAGSASQCEGAVADQGRSPALTDMLSNLLALTGQKTPNDYVTNEHYYLYKQDIERFAAMGVEYYYFTIPWTRILPFALPDTPINSEAIDHYDDVINFILEKGLKPAIALTHFDTPLQFFGNAPKYLGNYLATRAYYGVAGNLNFGYQNTTFEDAFVNYAEIVMTHYADRVPIWFTFNEPQVGSPNGIAVNNVLKAHARVTHFYRDVLEGTGQISMKMGAAPGAPYRSDNASDVAAAQYYTDLYLNTFLNPLVLGKDYPDAFKWAIQDYVPLSENDLEYLKGTIDFISVDAYSTSFLSLATPDFETCAKNNASSNTAYRFPICLQKSNTRPDGWSVGYNPASSPIGYTTPLNLYDQLEYLWNTFNIPIVVSEFGLNLPQPTGNALASNLYNVPTSEYLLSFLQQMFRAIEDGIDIMGAFVWNWGDDWEFTAWDNGFGLQYINRTTQQRYYRRSFFDVMEYVGSRREGCDENDEVEGY